MREKVEKVCVCEGAIEVLNWAGKVSERRSRVNKDLKEVRS